MDYQPIDYESSMWYMIFPVLGIGRPGSFARRWCDEVC